MNYCNDDVRRRDRLLDEARALELLQQAEYGVLSMIDEEGAPYGIPINHIWDGASCIYIPKARSSELWPSTARSPSVSSGGCTCYRASSPPSTKVPSFSARRISNLATTRR